MTTWNPRANELFLKAMELITADERQKYLASACAGDEALRAEVESLLEASSRAGGFLESPASAPVGDPYPTVDDPIAERPGTVIGPYKLLQRIGEGGMGSVFMAEQTHPVQRKVALKIIKPGMDSHHVMVRFEAERQALALMDHPNIAKVLDAGTTETGRPYFVMELVKGMSITKYCDEHRLSPKQRLELFMPVCQAIQHAHQKGIIHRDLKPSNVLVTEYDDKPVAKVIDFGVAKATGSKLTEHTMFTGFGQVVGTLEYMSPEQAKWNALDIDTRTDIYALGVLLYELLTGTTPFEKKRLREAALDEILRIIREEEPPRPSTRLSTAEGLPTLAANRGTEPAKLTKLVRGELDWIVMKALEKDRSRRYETANGLAMDVQRYLADEPVEACPPSATYRLRKFASKHRHLIGAAATFALLLATGAAVSVWQAMRARAAERQALSAQYGEAEQRKQAQAVLAFVQKHVFAAARPLTRGGGLGQEITLRRALQAALPAVDVSFAGQPLTEARVRTTLGTSFWYLGELHIAAAQQERARAIYMQLVGPDDAATLENATELASVYADLGKYDEALELREDTLARQKTTLGPDHADTLKSMRNLANSYADASRREDAIKLEEETLALAKAKFGPDDQTTLSIMNNLALDYGAVGRHEDALKLKEQTLALRKAKFGPDHLDTLAGMLNLAMTYTDLHRYQEAVDLYQNVLALQRAKLDPDHPEVLKCMYNLANAYGFLERYADALKLHQETLTLRRAKLHADHPEVLWSMWGVAANLFKLNRGAEAVPITDEIVDLALRLKIQPDLVGLLNRRMEYFQKAKDSAGCRRTAEQWEKLRRTDPRSLYSAACYRAVTAGVIRASDKSPEAVKQADAEETRAMAWLKQAVDAGYEKVSKIKQDADLDTLRDRADFRKLVADLEARQQKK
jgi:serine/threonine protein kinase/tetratricopeptide (TPR) repeat protein